MKISKERLKQIIQEEMKIAEEEGTPADGENPALAKTKSEFANKLLELSKQVRNLQGLDAKEMEALLGLIVQLIELSSQKNVGATLQIIKKKISQMIGEK